jgi:hypothetical protein
MRTEKTVEVRCIKVSWRLFGVKPKMFVAECVWFDDYARRTD